ncbi:MAG: ABC transporter permease, partial [Oscillospiraceae bacterium]
MKTKYVSAPYLLWMMVFIFAPLCLVVYFAFTDKGGNFTLANLSELTQYAPVFLRSVMLAGFATMICLAIAYPISYMLSRMTASRQKIMLMLIILPMWMNFLLRTYAWMSLLERNGIINKFFGLFGIGPFKMINTQGAVILGMVYNFLPFMIMPLYTIMLKIDHSLVEAAQD